MSLKRTDMLAGVLGILAVGLSSGVAAQKGGSKPPPPPPTPDKIAFVRSGQVFTMGSDGASQTQITFASGSYTSATFPTWLPDGRIVFGRTKTSGSGEVWIMNSNGSGATMLAVLPDYVVPDWNGDGNPDFPPQQLTGAWGIAVSPDGKFVSFAGVSGSFHMAAYVMRTDGVGGPVLASGMRNQYDEVIACNWSPDLDPNTTGYQGKLLVGHSRPVASNSNYVELAAVDLAYDSAGGNFAVGAEALVMANAVNAKWSPDGARLAMIDSGGRYGNGTGYTLKAIDIPYAGGQPVFPLNPAGLYAVAVTPSGGGWFDSLNWKPDSTSLVTAFRYATTTQLDVCTVVIPPVGGGTPGTPVRLTTNKASEVCGSWSKNLF